VGAPRGARGTGNWRGPKSLTVRLQITAPTSCTSPAMRRIQPVFFTSVWRE
jgi:hypothetical protein